MPKRTHSSNDEVAQRIGEAQANGAADLDLSGLGLTELPRQIGQLRQLQRLNLRTTN